MSAEYTPRLVSVIVPTFNRMSRLPRALASVKRQNYRPIEILIIDDGSTDRSLCAVTEWAALNEEAELSIRYIQQTNCGAPAARNHGLIECKGEYIQYLDSDDVLLPGKISAQLDCMKFQNKDYIWSQLKVLPDDGNGHLTPEELSSAPGDMYFLNDTEMPDAAYVGLYRRSLCIAIGPWDETLPCRQDSDYRYRCEALNPPRLFLPRLFYIAFEHSEGRINDQYLTEIGAEALLVTLEHGVRCGDKFGVRLQLYGRYFLALRIAMKLGRGDLVLRAMDGLKRSNPSFFQSCMIKWLKVTHGLLGPAMTIWLVDAYSAARGG
jgi:glycosyltransferase involved in cell wall biosynthesis